MQLFQLQPKHKGKPKKRVGRGGKRGTYTGRGCKGQKSRAGRGIRPGFAGGDTTLLKRLPKKRGTTSAIKIKRGSKLPRKVKPVSLNFRNLEKRFKKGEIISPKSLLKGGLVKKIKNRIPPVKILGQNKTKSGIIFKGVRLSKKMQSPRNK